ncbi:MAG: hypothetical protein WCJ17_03445 [bacterium]
MTRCGQVLIFFVAACIVSLQAAPLIKEADSSVPSALMSLYSKPELAPLREAAVRLQDLIAEGAHVTKIRTQAQVLAHDIYTIQEYENDETLVEVLVWLIDSKYIANPSAARKRGRLKRVAIAACVIGGIIGTVLAACAVAYAYHSRNYRIRQFNFRLANLSQYNAQRVEFQDAARKIIALDREVRACAFLHRKNARSLIGEDSAGLLTEEQAKVLSEKRPETRKIAQERSVKVLDNAKKMKREINAYWLRQRGRLQKEYRSQLRRLDEYGDTFKNDKPLTMIICQKPEDPLRHKLCNPRSTALCLLRLCKKENLPISFALTVFSYLYGGYYDGNPFDPAM